MNIIEADNYLSKDAAGMRYVTYAERWEMPRYLGRDGRHYHRSLSGQIYEDTPLRPYAITANWYACDSCGAAIEKESEDGC